MNGFLAEDVKEIASANRLPRLDHVHELVSESESFTLKSKKKHVQVLRQCLLLQLECCVTEAQRSRSIPQPTELAQLPVFRQARAIDSTYVLQEKESHARREEEEARLRMEQERLEAEKRVERQKEKEAQRQKRLESKELRRQERMAAKKESRVTLREEKRQRYEQELDAWQEALREKQDSLDALHDRIKRADVQRKDMAESLSIIDKEKEALLERLRHVVRLELFVFVLERWCLIPICNVCRQRRARSKMKNLTSPWPNQLNGMAQGVKIRTIRGPSHHRESVHQKANM